MQKHCKCHPAHGACVLVAQDCEAQLLHPRAQELKSRQQASLGEKARSLSVLGILLLLLALDFKQLPLQAALESCCSRDGIE